MKAEDPMARVVRGITGRITEEAIEHAATLIGRHGSPDELVIRDVDLKGFVVKLRATGRHSYAVLYGRGKVLTLGPAARLSAGKARKAAREALAQTSLDGEPLRAERKRSALTLDEFLTTLYEPWAAEHLKTAAETVARLRVNFADLLTTRLAEISPFAIERFRTARLKAGKTKATVNRDVVALKAALSRAVAWGHLKAHPLAPVKPYREDRRAIVRYLSAEEERRLLQALDARDATRHAARESANAWRRERGYEEWPAYGAYTDHISPIVRLALHTGLRRGELFNLRWRDLDLTRALLTVHGDGAKSGYTRHIPLNTTAVDTLTQWHRAGNAAGDARVFRASRVSGSTT